MGTESALQSWNLIGPFSVAGDADTPGIRYEEPEQKPLVAEDALQTAGQPIICNQCFCVLPQELVDLLFRWQSGLSLPELRVVSPLPSLCWGAIVGTHAVRVGVEVRRAYP